MLNVAKCMLIVVFQCSTKCQYADPGGTNQVPKLTNMSLLARQQTD